MNKTFLWAVSFSLTAVMMTACQNNENKTTEDNSDPKALSAQAIEVHDEIMPQISKFDKTSVKIDSILNGLSASKDQDAELDTAAIRTELVSLKGDIESATDDMMDWMRNYRLDSLDATYQQSEVERIQAMRAEFDKVNQQIEAKMKSYTK